METINVKVTKANFQIRGSIQNFTVEEHPYDQGAVVGYGPTLELALNAFEAMYEVRHDKQVKAKIVEQ